MKVKLNVPNGVRQRTIGGATVLYTKNGAYRWRKAGRQMVLMPPPPKKQFNHPWKTVVRWYEYGQGLRDYEGNDMEGYGAVVTPGLVNGIDPVAVAAWGEGGNIAKVERQKEFSRAPGLLDFPVIPLKDFEGDPAQLVDALGFAKDRNEFNKKLDHLRILNKNGGDVGQSPLLGFDTSESSVSVGFVYLKMPLAPRVVLPAVSAPISSATGITSAQEAVAGLTVAAIGTPPASTILSGNSLSVSEWRDRCQIRIGLTKDGDGGGWAHKVVAEIFLVGNKGGAQASVYGGQASVFVRHRCFWNLQFRVNRLLNSSSEPIGGHMWFT